MSKLADVRRELKNKTKVVIVGERETEREAFPHQMVEIFVAPVVPLYTERKLQNFMQSLIPLPTDGIDWFWARWWDKKYAQLDFGKLYFDEKLPNGLWRRILVKLYPDIEIAKGALIGVYEYHIPKSKFPPTLNSQGVVARFLNFFRSL